MIYIILTIAAVIMAGAAFGSCSKPGKNDNISKYDNLED